MSDDELRRRLDRLAGDSPTPDERRRSTVRSARRRARLAMMVAGVAGAATVIVGVLAVNAVVDRPRPPAPSVAVPAPTGTAVPEPTENATPPPDPEGRLAFWSDSPAGGSAALMLIDADGTHPQAVGDLSISTARLALSTDGSSAIFSHGLNEGSRQLEVMDMSTGDSRTMSIEGNPQDPDWASDGTIAFSTDSGALFTVPSSADSNASPVLASATGDPVEGLFPTWSPDGRELAYIDASGSLLIRSMASPTPLRAMDVPGRVAWVDWSEAGIVVATSDGGDFRLFRVDPDGVAPSRPLRDLEGDQTWPALSPDGRFVAFVGNAGGQSDLYVLRLSDGVVERLTRDRRQELSPVWSPIS